MLRTQKVTKVRNGTQEVSEPPSVGFPLRTNKHKENLGLFTTQMPSGPGIFLLLVEFTRGTLIPKKVEKRAPLVNFHLLEPHGKNIASSDRFPLKPARENNKCSFHQMDVKRETLLFSWLSQPGEPLYPKKLDHTGTTGQPRTNARDLTGILTLCP